jgi:hypothetical protein
MAVVKQTVSSQTNFKKRPHELRSCKMMSLKPVYPGSKTFALPRPLAQGILNLWFHLLQQE